MREHKNGLGTSTLLSQPYLTVTVPACQNPRRPGACVDASLHEGTTKAVTSHAVY
jgi:hypothetical protein